MKRLLIPLLVLGALFLGGCSSLLFYPEPVVQITPARAGLEYRDVTLTTADGVRLRAWWLPAKKGVPVKGTVLYLHGNGGNLSWHLGGTWWLPAEGYQVLMLDYRGYGQSEGQPGLPEVYRDIDAAFAWLDQAPEVKGTERVLLGQSLGGALAIHYLAEHPQRQGQFKALVFDGVPASYRGIARHMLDGSWLTWPLQVPLSWLVPDDDSAIHSVARLSGAPMLFFHSIDDTIVPLERHRPVPPGAAAEGPATDPRRPRADLRRSDLAGSDAALPRRSPWLHRPAPAGRNPEPRIRETRRQSMSDRNVLPCILTGIGTIFVTVGVLWYYGYLHFAKPQDALLLADFTMLKSLPGEDVKLSLEPAKQVAQCIDGVLVLFDTEQKGLSGVLVDNRKHAVRCAGQEVPQEVK